MTAIEDVCWALARECRNDDVLIVGVATPLAAAAAFLARECLVPDLTIIVGGAVDPPATDVAQLLIDPFAVSRTSQVMLGQRELLPLLQRGSITLQFVSPAQVDHTGAINTSRIHLPDGTWRRLPGCLALPDTAAMIGRLIAYRIDGGDRFTVERVDYVSGMGHEPETREHYGLTGAGVSAIITEHGRRTLGPHSATTELEPIPADASAFIAGVLDPHGVLGIETHHARTQAVAALAALSAEDAPRG